MNTEEELDQRIAELKLSLRSLLEDKREILEFRLKKEGCTCISIIRDFNVTRLVDYYCKVHKGK